MNGLSEFLNSPGGLALKAALIAAFVDFATGVYAALKDDTFTMDAIAAFLRKHILGRIAPLGTMLALGYWGGDGGMVFVPFAVAGLTAYAAETASSIKGNFLPPKESDVKAESINAAEAINPVPTE